MRLLLLVLFIGGCAAPAPQGPPPLGPHEIRSAQSALDGLFTGRTTKAEVRAALGEAIVIDFDSGYEVWVYREPLPEKQPPPATELVLLFTPSGTLAKTRIR